MMKKAILLTGILLFCFAASSFAAPVIKSKVTIGKNYRNSTLERTFTRTITYDENGECLSQKYVSGDSSVSGCNQQNWLNSSKKFKNGTGLYFEENGDLREKYQAARLKWTGNGMKECRYMFDYEYEFHAPDVVKSAKTYYRCDEFSGRWLDQHIKYDRHGNKIWHYRAERIGLEMSKTLKSYQQESCSITKTSYILDADGKILSSADEVQYGKWTQPNYFSKSTYKYNDHGHQIYSDTSTSTGSRWVYSSTYTYY